MKLGNSLSIGLSQKLILTEKMKQSLEILQMNIKELEEFLENEQENNIIMTIEKKDIARGTSYKNNEYDPYESISTKEESFYDYLYTQIGEKSLNKKMREICEYIIDNIDSRGYLSHKVRHPYSQFDFNKGLEIVRGFEPRGVGGKDLKDCLLLQLDKNEVYEKLLIKNHLEELAYGNKIKIAKALGIDVDKINQIIDRVKSLNPIPSNGFYIEDRRENLIPDAYIIIDGEDIEIKLNEEVIPNILIEQSNLVTNDLKYEKYILKCKKRAEFIINCINQRQETFKKVINEIVNRQREYFFKGELKSLTLLEVANSLEIHQSTVSRAIKNRYIDIEGNVIVLKKLFAKQFRPKNNNGTNDEMTREHIKDLIYKVIMKEDKSKPYSDENIVKILLKDKINISRRTIAKYRKEALVPSSSKRKRKKKEK